MDRIIFSSALALLIFAAGGTALAKTGDRTNDHVGFVGNTMRVEPHARFPSDVAYEFGTVNVHGTKKTPYVEKCYWRTEPSIFIFKNLTQVCTRYTIENTQ